MASSSHAVVPLLVLCAASVVGAQSLDEARALHRAGQFAEALESYRSVAETLETDPAAAGTALNNACVIRMNTGDLPGALEDCNEALRLRHLVGDDRPGIIHDISQALARRDINVSELATSCESAPMSGEALFRATASLLLPSGVTIEELREDLEKIAHDLMVDLTHE